MIGRASGFGELHATTIWDGRQGARRLLASIDFPHSLGLLNAGLTAWLGFAVNEGHGPGRLRSAAPAEASAGVPPTANCPAGGPGQALSGAGSVAITATW